MTEEEILEVLKDGGFDYRYMTSHVMGKTLTVWYRTTIGKKEIFTLTTIPYFDNLDATEPGEISIEFSLAEEAQ